MSPVFGAYVAGDGFAHRLDARVKVLLLLLATVAAFGAANLGAALALLGGAVACAVLVGVAPRSLAAAAVPAAVVLVFAFLANALVADGTGDVTLFGSFGVSWDGLARGVLVVARILSLVAWCAVFSATTSSADLCEAVAAFAAPLRGAGAPVDAWAMTLSLAVRFVPDTLGELANLRDAQAARGVDLAVGGPVRRVRRMAALLVPLTVAEFRRSLQVAEAMEDRCWGQEPWAHERRPLGAGGWLALGCGIVLCVACCGVGR